MHTILKTMKMHTLSPPFKPSLSYVVHLVCFSSQYLSKYTVRAKEAYTKKESAAIQVHWQTLWCCLKTATNPSAEFEGFIE